MSRPSVNNHCKENDKLLNNTLFKNGIINGRFFNRSAIMKITESWGIANVNGKNKVYKAH